MTGHQPDLDQNETVLASARPHYNYFIKSAFFIIVVIVAVVIVLWKWKGAPAWSGFAGLGIYLICSLYLLIKILKWRSQQMTVTTLRVIFSSGIFTKTLREIPNYKISGWYCRSGPWQRIVKAGTIVLETPEVQFPPVFHSDSKKLIKRLINMTHPKYEVAHPEEMMKAIRKGVLPWRPDNNISRDDSAIADRIANQLIILADLHRAGALSDEEFKQKSQDILNHG